MSNQKSVNESTNQQLSSSDIERIKDYLLLLIDIKKSQKNKERNSNDK